MINKVILIGNVGADPEIRTIESGTKVARIRLATTEKLYNRATQESRDHTEWHTVTLWAGLADVADRYVRKGSQIYIEGSIRSNEWTDANDIKRYGVEILGRELRLLGRRGDNPSDSPASTGGDTKSETPAAKQGGATAPSQEREPAIPKDDIDDLPF